MIDSQAKPPPTNPIVPGNHEPTRQVNADEFNVMLVGAVVEGALVALAFALAWLGVYDRARPLGEIDWNTCRRAAIWGAVFTIPLLIYLAFFHFFSVGPLRPMREFVDRQLRPLFARSSLFELAVLSLLAGFCEELFFRWALQGGIAHVIGGNLGAVAGLIIASVIFGVCHWVNYSYGLTTMIVGAYLGWTMILTDTFLVPAVAHALFDFIAFLYIVRPASGLADAGLPNQPEEPN